MTDSDGDIFCNKCAEAKEDASLNKGIQKMILKLQTRCMSINGENNEDDDEGSGENIIDTQVKDNECDWIGMIQDWEKHEEQCQFLIINCEKCIKYKCQRKLMDQHDAECPETEISCPLLCGSTILRKDTESHIANDCAEAELSCSNDDCKESVKRKDYEDHVNNQCEDRIVDCEYVKYGCNVQRIKAKDIKFHMNEYKFDHLAAQFNTVTTQV